MRVDLDLSNDCQPVAALVQHTHHQVSVPVVLCGVWQRELVLDPHDGKAHRRALLQQPLRNLEHLVGAGADHRGSDRVEDVGSERQLCSGVRAAVRHKLLSHPRLGLDGCPVDAKLGPEPALHCPPHAQLELFVQQLRPAVQLADEDLLVEDWSPHAGDGARERPGATGATAMRKLNLSPVFSMQPDGTHARVVLPPHASQDSCPSDCGKLSTASVSLIASPSTPASVTVPVGKDSPGLSTSVTLHSGGGSSVAVGRRPGGP
eukprot:CAMPEP_0202813594 /NCGR_PEP_ID=MMETSP1389-20130828/4915_1 /ASSEMBLY_ACC=CAM_ASM_000865 /TAXON_ID=302021 /ORGANISM="Rhodomonas sp., Strain CCMP768" /LENGTH=261 /DNA_ID=CAMNT_0049485207 /DNA_START=141 /DNA_END=924 /DNA_ORIENTATION=+